MASIDDLRSLVERLAESADVRSVYGDPVEVHDRTVIPVARVMYGFGGGYGSGPAANEENGDERGGKDGKQDGDDGEGRAGDGEEAIGQGEGAGLGGGAGVTPVGVVEITDDDTRFVRFSRKRRAAGVVLAGLLVGYLLGRRGSE